MTDVTEAEAVQRAQEFAARAGHTVVACRRVVHVTREKRNKKGTFYFLACVWLDLNLMPFLPRESPNKVECPLFSFYNWFMENKDRLCTFTK